MLNSPRSRAKKWKNGHRNHKGKMMDGDVIVCVHREIGISMHGGFVQYASSHSHYCWVAVKAGNGWLRFRRRRRKRRKVSCLFPPPLCLATFLVTVNGRS